MGDASAPNSLDETASPFPTPGRMTDASETRAPERLLVRGFACLKSIEIEIQPFTVVIGEQASGKSILAKLIHYFKSYYPGFRGAVFQGETLEGFNQKFVQRFREAFPEQFWGAKPFSLEYRCGSESITLERTEGLNLKIRITDGFLNAYRQSESVFKKAAAAVIKATEESEFPDDRKWEALNEMTMFLREFGDTHFPVPVSAPQNFIPAGRSFLANLENIFTYLSSGNHIDSYLKSFGSYYEGVKNSQRSRPSVHQGTIDEITTTILRGSHFRRDNKDWITNLDGREIPVSRSSSGQQEALPLCLILASFASFGRGLPQGFYIEEPEAHLFPRSQRAIVELIALAYNARKQTCFFITTHSPYVLTALNNLLQAGKLFREQPLKSPQIRAIVPPFQAIDPLQFAAYSIDSNGLSDLMCRDSQLIEASKIDEVSADLAIEFDKLMDLE